MDFLQMLPLEISIKILTLLDLRDILSCQAVCRAWYDLTNNNFVWKTFWDESFPLKECRPRKDLSMTLGIPCKWKMYIMNHIRVIKNWREDRYKRYEVNGRLLDTTAYDGKTLVIKNDFGLEVYKIDRGNLIHVQKLNYKKYDAFMCTTNTNYIAAKFKPFLLIYQLVNDKYRLSHMLYTQGMNPKLICVRQHKQMDKIKDRCPIYPYWSNIMCIIEDTLFVYMPHVKVLYAWDMKGLRTLMEVNLKIRYWNNDKTRVYICCNNVINVYDQSGKMCLCVNTNWNIGRILVNQNIFLAVNAGQDIMEIRSWDKVTGKELMTRKVAISYDCLLHPKENILFDVDDAWELERKEIFALDLKDDVTLWKTLIGEYNLLGDLHSIVADKFLLFCTYSSHVFDLHDTKTGNYLYSLHGIEDDDVFASYDILIYNNNKNVKMIIHIYS